MTLKSKTSLAVNNKYEKLRRSDDCHEASFVVNNRIRSNKSPVTIPAASDPKIYFTTLAWLSMILAVISGSAIGPAFKWFEQHGIHELLTASWRCQVMAIILLPLAIIEARYLNHPWHWLTLKRPADPDLKYPVWTYILTAGLAWSLNLCCWIIGLEYTTTVRASLFSGTHPLMLAIYLYFSGRHVSGYMWTGVMVSFAGLAFIALFSDGPLYKAVLGTTHRIKNTASSSSGGGDQSWFGDLLCLVAACAEVVVITNRDRTKHLVPVVQYTALTTLCVALMTTICASFYTSATFFCTSDNCLFGWMSSRWISTMFIFGFVVGVVCVGGFNFSMQYIHPLIFSCVLLVDPAVTGVISWLIGVEGLPDLFTTIGGLIVVVGVALVTIGESSSAGSGQGDSAQQRSAFQMIKLTDDEDDVWNDDLVDDLDLNDDMVF